MAERVVQRLCDLTRAAAARAVGEFVASQRAAGRTVRVAAVVAGSDVDPATIANAHMRAHASEGRLYRDVIVDALRACGIESVVFLERELPAAAATALGSEARACERTVAALKEQVGPPWRAEEKAAALAAWVALARG